jgi:hypothetical protein
MTLAELIKDLGCEVLTGDLNLDQEIRSGYASDLLSDVIANVQANSVWITIQRHINILGVAKLRDVTAIMIPRNLQLESSVVDKAIEEGISILRDGRTAFELSALIYNALRKG